MAWKTEYTAQVGRDLDLIFDHLFQSYRSFGEPAGDAFERAALRLRAIKAAGDAIATAPHRGTRRDDILPGARSVTIDRAIFWFALDEARRTVRILAVVFGDRDHVRHMLVRLLEE
tara:strand:+ start:46 stop:393 length:348 start_codon:yes stop_codon:yes gene_type:complete